MCEIGYGGKEELTSAKQVYDRIDQSVSNGSRNCLVSDAKRMVGYGLIPECGTASIWGRELETALFRWHCSELHGPAVPGSISEWLKSMNRNQIREPEVRFALLSGYSIAMVAYPLSLSSPATAANRCPTQLTLQPDKSSKLVGDGRCGCSVVPIDVRRTSAISARM